MPGPEVQVASVRVVNDMRRARTSLEFLIAAILLFLLSFGSRAAISATGCTLSNPVQDLKYLFPQMTSYKEELRDFSKMNDGRDSYRALNVRLGSDLDQLFEGYGTQYTIYIVFKESEILGIVHGVNVPGEAGLIQVVLSMNPDSGTIRRVSYQRLDSRAAPALNRREFLDQFDQLSLADFYRHDYYQIAEPGSERDRISRIKNPVAGHRGASDYDATVRAVRKNLILLDFFVYNRRFDAFYQQTRTRLARRGH